jgi:photosystem II stability/assembly factor-like uncharacterized protein
MHKATIVISLAIAAGALTACGHVDNATPAALTVRTTPAVIDSGGHAWARADADTVAVTADAGGHWSDVRLPATAAPGHSVVVRGDLVAAVTVDANGPAYQHSADGGTTWTRSSLGEHAPTDTTDIAVSDDGRRVAVLAAVAGSAGTGGQAQLFTGTASGALVARSVPVGGDIVWSGHTLLLAGGPLHSQLYSSADSGATWTRRPVDGTLSPRFDVSPDTTGIGTPVPTSDGTVLVPLTEHAHGHADVVVYRSTDDATFTATPEVTLAGDLGPGATAVVATAGADGYVVVDPAADALHVVRGATRSVLRPIGLTGPIEALTFTDAENGFADVTQSTGCATKATCTQTDVAFRTTDGGHTWHRATT